MCVKICSTLNGRAFPRVFWMPFSAVATDTGMDRTVWMAAETTCSSWKPLENSHMNVS